MSAIGPKRTCRQHLRMSDLEVRQASQLTPEAWEELIAGAFKKDALQYFVDVGSGEPSELDVVWRVAHETAGDHTRLVPEHARQAVLHCQLGMSFLTPAAAFEEARKIVDNKVEGPTGPFDGQR